MNRRWISSFAYVTGLAAATVVFAAAAMAQTPAPTPSPTAGATATHTTVVTGTVAATHTVTTTQVATPIPTIPISENIYVAGGTGGFAFAHPAFQRVWTRTDKPVLEGKLSRTWFWGPGPNTPGLLEQYNEDPLGRKLRLVQYFDKSRM